MLRAFDRIAQASMEAILPHLGHKVPPVLTYLDKGMGASILRAGLRLWDGSTLSPAAAIKIIFHNRRRPTALLHETGHQVAYLLRWNETLATRLHQSMTAVDAGLASVWASWASEIAADFYAFAHAGYGSVVALADVVGGTTAEVLRDVPGGPHPIPFLRVQLGIACCRRFFGRGPWDELDAVWRQRYPIDEAPGETRAILAASLPRIPSIGECGLLTPSPSFGGRCLVDWLNPDRSSPTALAALHRESANRPYASRSWLHRDSVRLLALTGFRLATEPGQFLSIIQNHDQAIRVLGGHPFPLDMPISAAA